MKSNKPAHVVWYIHGANGTPLSFSWIKQQLPGHICHDIDYPDEPLTRTIENLIELAKQYPLGFDIIAHSMGGIIAVALAQKAINVGRIFTMSTPFGGSRIANILRWYYPCQTFENIHTNNQIIVSLRTIALPTTILSLVTTGGRTPMMTEENDGVVSVTSQMSLRGPEYIRLPLNHFEILLSSDTIKYIRDFIFHDIDAYGAYDDRLAG